MSKDYDAKRVYGYVVYDIGAGPAAEDRQGTGGAVAEASELTGDEEDFVAQMKRRHVARFASCECGRTDIMLFKRPEMTNGSDSDVYTYHHTPSGVSCENGGKDVPKERRL